MGELANWGKKNSPYLKIGDNETVKVAFEGYKIVPDNRDPSKEKIRYEFEWERETKYFESASSAVAMKLDSAKVGDIFYIHKSKQGDKNRYEVMTPDEFEASQQE